MGADADWRADLDRWLEPFVSGLNHAARRAMCPHDVAGLMGLGDRKSMQPTAVRQEGLSYDRLQHFISVGRRDEAPLARALLAEADRSLADLGGKWGYALRHGSNLTRSGASGKPGAVLAGQRQRSIVHGG